MSGRARACYLCCEWGVARVDVDSRLYCWCGAARRVDTPTCVAATDAVVGVATSVGLAVPASAASTITTPPSSGWHCLAHRHWRLYATTLPRPPPPSPRPLPWTGE